MTPNQWHTLLFLAGFYLASQLLVILIINCPFPEAL